jgi:hypothetical protein
LASASNSVMSACSAGVSVPAGSAATIVFMSPRTVLTLVGAAAFDSAATSGSRIASPRAIAATVPAVA